MIDRLEKDPLSMLKLYMRDKSALSGSTKFFTLKDFRMDMEKFGIASISGAELKELTLKWWKTVESKSVDDDELASKEAPGSRKELKLAQQNSVVKQTPAEVLTPVEVIDIQSAIKPQPQKELPELAPQDDIHEFMSSVSTGREISKALGQRLLRQPLSLAYEANSVHKRLFELTLKSNQEIAKSCQAPFAVLMFLSIPTESVRDPNHSDGISAKVRRDFLQAVPVDAQAIFKRALEELAGEDRLSAKRTNLSIRFCQLIVAANERALEPSNDASSWHWALKEVSAVDDVLAGPAVAICQRGFANSLRADTDSNAVKDVLASMRDEDLTLSIKKQKLFTWLLSKGQSVTDLENDCTSITLSSWLAASRSEFVSNLNPSIVDRITDVVIENFDHKSLSNSDFGLYVNAAPRVAALVPENVVDALFTQACRTLPALKLIAERLKTSGQNAVTDAQISVTKEALATKDQALQLLAKQMTNTMAALEKSQSDLLRVQGDFQQQLESSRSNLVHKLAESLAVAISEMESQFGIATVEQTSGRILARMNALGVEKLNKAGDTVGFDSGIHESKERNCNEGELVQVVVPGFVYTYENQRRVLIKSLVA